MKKHILLVILLLITLSVGALLFTGCGNLDRSTQNYEAFWEYFNDGSDFWTVVSADSVLTADQAQQGIIRQFTVATYLYVSVTVDGAQVLVPQNFQVTVRLTNNAGTAAGQVVVAGAANISRHDLVIIQGAARARYYIDREFNSIITTGNPTGLPFN